MRPDFCFGRGPMVGLTGSEQCIFHISEAKANEEMNSRSLTRPGHAALLYSQAVDDRPAFPFLTFLLPFLHLQYQFQK